MRCPNCNSEDTRVVDTRTAQDFSVRRRRQCNICGYRFTTFERLEEVPIYVVKKDKGRVRFDREKLLRGLKTASTKRNISIETLEKIVFEIEKSLQNTLSSEVTTKVIGDMALEKLRELDQVAYVRFASVYKEFDDIKSFIEIVENIKRETKWGKVWG